MRTSPVTQSPGRRYDFGRQAFTLVELLVVIGIIALLIAILLPILSGARRSAQSIACASNIRQLIMALIAYQHENNARFPPNVSAPSPGQFWCQTDRIGQHLSAEEVNGAGELGGGVFVCPADDEGARSYAMNVWASSKVSPIVLNASPPRGRLWETFAFHPSQIILVTEKWSTIESPEGWLAQQTVGFVGKKPGQRFGAGGGVGPPFNAGRFGLVSTDMDFSRHSARDPFPGVLPDSRVNIGYADGHVELNSAGELADFQTGLSTHYALWSPIDKELNN